MPGIIKLLVALPLLLPQGLCICDSLTTCQACAEPAASVETSAPACSCCIEDDKTPTLTATHTCEPQPGEPHVPGCPVKEDAQWKADLKAPSPLLAVDFTCIADSLDCLAVPSAQSNPFADFHGKQRPIYLTLLTLRI
jgi:hypothetical protein